MIEQNTQEQNIQDNARRVVILYKILEDNINKGSIIGIAIWSNALLNCIAHIEVDNRRLFGL